MGLSQQPREAAVDNVCHGNIFLEKADTPCCWGCQVTCKYVHLNLCNGSRLEHQHSRQLSQTQYILTSLLTHTHTHTHTADPGSAMLDHFNHLRRQWAAKARFLQANLKKITSTDVGKAIGQWRRSELHCG